MRVSRQVINETVERKGVHCTHVDALKYFAEAASPLNHFGGHPPRVAQLSLEQPACVHAQMDLIKMSLRLQPFLDASLLCECLQVGLEARRLDVAASPYDALELAGLEPVRVETPEGRAQYRQVQSQLMKRAAPVRRRLLRAYQVFLQLAFEEETLREAEQSLLSRKQKASNKDHGQAIQQG